MNDLARILEGLTRVGDLHALFTSLFANAPVSFIVYDKTGRCVLSNKATAELFGAHPPPDYNIFEDEIARAQGSDKLIRAAFAGETVKLPRTWYERRAPRHAKLQEGSRVAIEGVAFPIRDASGAIQLVAFALKDVTAEERLREANESLVQRERESDATIQSIGDAVIATDRECRVVRMNPIAEGLTGWKLTEALGKPLTDVFRIVHEETGEALENPATRVLRIGTITGLASHTALVRRDGSEIPVADSSAPILDGEGTTKGVVLVFRDATAERRTAELTRENHRIQTASQLKNAFLANMSHELRTPLNAIIGFAELLHEGDVPPDSPEHKEFLGSILSSGLHLLQLINDILDLGKIEAGKIDVDPEEVSPSVLVGEVVGALRSFAAQKQIRVGVDIDTGVATAILDPRRFKQILYNYLSNAVKFTEPGGRVWVRVFPEGPAALRLEVEDTGIGIAEHDLIRLFVEFQQLDSGIRKQHGGAGLGLALTRRVAEAMGGRVGVRSVPGKGSVFFVILPRDTTPFATNADPE